MSKKIKIITIIVLIITILPINISAEITDEKQYYCLVSSPNQPGLQFIQIATVPTSFGIGSTGTLFIGYQASEIIPDGTVMVMTVTLDNQIDTQPRQVGVGQMASGAITTTHTGDFFLNMPYDQEIIATTVQLVSEGTRITVTSRAQGYTNKYPFMRIEPIAPIDSEWAVKIADLDMYDTILDAAGSGTTPEEMREVLDAWGEEELIPGIGQEIGNQIDNKVPSAVEDALNKHDQQQETQGNSKIEEFKEQISEIIDPYFENTEQISDALHSGFGGVFGYGGTNATITFPAAHNPMADGALLWPEQTVDLGYWWNRLPAALRAFITAYSTFVILYACISEMLDTINTILIHRELLGMPDDEIFGRAKSR